MISQDMPHHSIAIKGFTYIDKLHSPLNLLDHTCRTILKLTGSETWNECFPNYFGVEHYIQIVNEEKDRNYRKNKRP